MLAAVTFGPDSFFRATENEFTDPVMIISSLYPLAPTVAAKE